jgi:hypothetical protein
MKTSNKTIEQLRGEGYKIRVIHFRVLGADLIPERELREQNRLCEVTNSGGKTIAQVTSPDGRESEGEATVNYKDYFNRKIGAKVALGRALKKLETKVAA